MRFVEKQCPPTLFFIFIHTTFTTKITTFTLKKFKYMYNLKVKVILINENH